MPIISGPYTKEHASPAGPGDARPTSVQVVQDQGLEGRLSDKVVLITGGSAGLGLEIAKAVGLTGATIYVTARNVGKAEESLAKHEETRHARVIKLELDSLESVRRGAADLLSKTKRLNVLVNNAGVMATAAGKTKDGFETQFGTNHLGHFLLFQLLKDTLIASSTPSFNSRVVSISSTGHRIAGLSFDDTGAPKLEDPDKDYNEWAAYGHSKTANIYFAIEADDRYSARGLHAVAVHPGTIMDTGLGRHLDMTNPPDWLNDELLAKLAKNSGQGAATPTWAAVGRELEGEGGVYLENLASAEPAEPDLPVYGPGYAEWAYDKKAAKQLWKVSLQMVGVQDDDGAA